MMPGPAAGALLALALLQPAPVPVADGAWLDRALVAWNRPGADVPPSATSAAPAETPAALRERCRIDAPATASRRALDAAGWVAYDHLDRPMASGDVEIVAGMREADSSCSAVTFQLFVFVGGRFAGTLSPQPMTTKRDGAAGPVRIAGSDAVTAEFMRFGPGDATCCPTARMTVRYRLDRSAASPVVVPETVRTSRGY